MHRAADKRHEYTTQSHYPDTGSTSPDVILLLSVELGNSHYRFKRIWFGSAGTRTRNLTITNQTLSTRPHSENVYCTGYFHIVNHNNVYILVAILHLDKHL